MSNTLNSFTGADDSLRGAASPERATQMKAARFAGPRRIEIEDVPLPEPGPHQVRVRLRGCGVCASNLPVWEGRPWFEYPLAPGAPGHEGWGVVDAVGAQVEHLEIGRPVACLSYHAFAEYDLAEPAHLVPLPKELASAPFPGEPLGCAFNVIARSDLQPGQTVAVIGVGFLGALLVALARESGARVIAISRRLFALEVARRMGADMTFCLNIPAGIAATVLDMTGGAGCERVIEAVGSQRALSLAGEIVAERGRLVIAGYHQDGPRQVNMQQWNWRGIDVINAHERDPQQYIRGMRRAVGAVLEGRLDPSPLYTHTFPLAELPAAMEMASARPDEFLKALIVNDA